MAGTRKRHRFVKLAWSGFETAEWGHQNDFQIITQLLLILLFHLHLKLACRAAVPLSCASFS
jgi:hypothetical protein